MSARRLFAFVALAVVGCGGDEAPSGANAVDAGSGEAGLDAAAPVEAGARIRTVEVRNPFGKSAEHNLMVDGDFELTSSSGQYGWLAIENLGQTALVRETGGLCRSGLTCAALAPTVDLIGFAAAPRDKGFEVSIYVKPPVPDCTLTVINVINCTGLIAPSGTFASVPPVSDAPDASGWCRHHAIAPATKLRPCLYVSSFAEDGTRTLVDEASLTAADGSGSGSTSLRSEPPSAELHARVTRALRVVQESTRLDRPNTWLP